MCKLSSIQKGCEIMGGRGTFASGNQVPFTYKTIGFIEDAKILEGISSKYHKLPEEAHSSEKYIKLKRNKIKK